MHNHFGAPLTVVLTGGLLREGSLYLEMLRAQVAHFAEFDGIFDEVLGLSNQLAVSKVHLAVDYLARTGEKAEECVFIGDTTHDAETAAAIGCRCYLIEGGHQERKVLDTAENAVVLPSLMAAVELLG